MIAIASFFAPNDSSFCRCQMTSAISAGSLADQIVLRQQSAGMWRIVFKFWGWSCEGRGHEMPSAIDFKFEI
jgi:hypothetical protein